MTLTSFQPTSDVHADVVALVCNWLRPLLPGVGVGRIVTDERPHLQVQRSGGLTTGLVDEAEIQFDVRALDWDDAFAIASKVRSVLPLSRLEIAEVFRAVERSGLFELQDGEHPRFVFTWLLAARVR